MIAPLGPLDEIVVKDKLKNRFSSRRNSSNRFATLTSVCDILFDNSSSSLQFKREIIIIRAENTKNTKSKLIKSTSSPSSNRLKQRIFFDWPSKKSNECYTIANVRLKYNWLFIFKKKPAKANSWLFQYYWQKSYSPLSCLAIQFGFLEPEEKKNKQIFRRIYQSHQFFFNFLSSPIISLINEHNCGCVLSLALKASKKHNWAFTLGNDIGDNASMAFESLVCRYNAQFVWFGSSQTRISEVQMLSSYQKKKKIMTFFKQIQAKKKKNPSTYQQNLYCVLKYSVPHKIQFKINRNNHLQHLIHFRMAKFRSVQ